MPNLKKYYGKGQTFPNCHAQHYPKKGWELVLMIAHIPKLGVSRTFVLLVKVMNFISLTTICITKHTKKVSLEFKALNKWMKKFYWRNGCCLWQKSEKEHGDGLPIHENMNVWFNHITTNTISLKPFRELWNGTKEKNMFVMQQLIKICSHLGPFYDM